MGQFRLIKIYVIIASLLFGLYCYAGLTGWKFFGSNTEKWEPAGEKKYHK